MNNTTLSKLRSPLKIKKLHYIMSRIVRGTPLGIRRSRIEGKRYLDVGCGYNINEDFINLDYTWHTGIDICWDITKGIPLPDNSVDGIFSEHCLEHLPIEENYKVFAEFRRIIAPGGTVRIIVPDGELYTRIYLDRQDNKSGKPFPFEDQDQLNELYTPIYSLNRIFRKWGHQFIFDADSMCSLLAHYGFEDVREVGYMEGRDPKLLIDTDWREIESLYVEASAPK